MCSECSIWFTPFVCAHVLCVLPFIATLALLFFFLILCVTKQMKSYVQHISTDKLLILYDKTVCVSLKKCMTHTLTRKGKVTLAAFVWPFSTVCFQMCPQIACCRGFIFTLVALVWLFSTVCYQMYL